MESPSIEIVVQHKIPNEDIALDVSPDFTLKEVAEILCYGTSFRGGCWVGRPEHGRTPPLPALMRFRYGDRLELPFDQSLKSLGIGHRSKLQYSSRVLRKAVVFSRSWQLLNGISTYFPTRCAMGHDGVEGNVLRKFAYMLCQAEGCKFALDDLELVSEETGDPVKDNKDIRPLFGEAQFLLKVRIGLTSWARRRGYFLMLKKGNAALMPQDSDLLAQNVNLLLFLQKAVSEEIIRKIAKFL